MGVSMVHVLLVSVCASLGYGEQFYTRPSQVRSLRQQRSVPRCSSANKPCRIVAEMQAGGSNARPQVIRSQPCSCPVSTGCSNDWQRDRDRVIVRELLTDGNMTMTLSMMFCDTVQPQRRCTADDVAVQLTGSSRLLTTEVDFINCRCSDHRPLQLHQKTVGRDHRHYHSYVCYNHKRRCKRGRRNRQTCMETQLSNGNVFYPCKCTSGTACFPAYTTRGIDHLCRRRPTLSTRYMRASP